MNVKLNGMEWNGMDGTMGNVAHLIQARFDVSKDGQKWAIKGWEIVWDRKDRHLDHFCTLASTAQHALLQASMKIAMRQARPWNGGGKDRPCRRSRPCASYSLPPTSPHFPYIFRKVGTGGKERRDENLPENGESACSCKFTFGQSVAIKRCGR